ncbi:MAG TPA: hypothetical protein VGJ70_13785 [Solirubrobacteraceae bacterium]
MTALKRGTHFGTPAAAAAWRTARLLEAAWRTSALTAAGLAGIDRR